jgi:hypothetical protein
MASVIELKQRFKELIELSFDSLVSYKKAAKSFSIMKRLMEKNLDVEEIQKSITFMKNKIKEVEKENIHQTQKTIMVINLQDKIKQYKELLKIVQQPNSNRFLVEIEKNFLKEKEIFRERKIKLLESIEIIISQLKDKMGEDKFKEYKNKLYINTLTDDTHEYTYSVKTIMNYLKSGAISEKSSQKVKQINNLATINNVKNRKKKMEIEVEMVKLQKKITKLREEDNKIKEKIKKIVEREGNTELKKKLENPVEFYKFINSNIQSNVYQPEIDKHKIKYKKLLNKIKAIENKIAELIKT